MSIIDLFIKYFNFTENIEIFVSIFCLILWGLVYLLLFFIILGIIFLLGYIIYFYVREIYERLDWWLKFKE